MRVDIFLIENNMPANTKEYRNDPKNKKKYWGSLQYLKDQVKRVQARRIMVKKWAVKKWDGKEVDHIKWANNWNSPSNLRVLTRLKNRQLGQKKATKSQRAKK